MEARGGKGIDFLQDRAEAKHTYLKIRNLSHASALDFPTFKQYSSSLNAEVRGL